MPHAGSERDPRFLIENGYLEKVEDFEFDGRKVRASRLGYRITALFVDRFLGRIFEMPGAVFPEEILRPEKQDMEAFVAGVDAIVEAQSRVAAELFRRWQRGCGVSAPARRYCTSWRTANGKAKAWRIESVRAMFTRESLLASDWYQDRLRAKQERDVALWERHIAALEGCGTNEARAIDVAGRLAEARRQMDRVRSVGYLAELMGTIGAEPSLKSAAR